MLWLDPLSVGIVLEMSRMLLGSLKVTLLAMGLSDQALCVVSTTWGASTMFGQF